MRTTALLPLAFFLAPIAAQDPAEIPEGHSHHGEAFNEGPRQKAYLMSTTGDVHMPVSTRDELAQAFFDQGLGQLHGFWYFEAERSFRQVAAIDPECAMAYWGMAMANHDNPERAIGFAREAWLRRGAGDARERMYIDALARRYDCDRAAPATEGSSEPSPTKIDGERNKSLRRAYIHDLEKLIGAFPDDIEAVALLANQLWLDQRDLGVRIVSRQANQALLDQVFAANPNHPAHHYRIHLWDSDETAYRAVDSAARIGQAAPGIAHMWHMGGHIWARLHRHEDAAWQQEASARVDHAHMMRDRVLPDQIHNYAHNNEWLTRSLRQVGRWHDAVDLAKNMIELPRHPKWNTLDGRRRSARYGRTRLIEVLVMYEQWNELLELAGTMYLETGSGARDRASREAMLGMAYLATGDRDAAAQRVAGLEDILAEVRAQRAQAVDSAEDAAFARDADREIVAAARDEAGAAFERDIATVRRLTDQLIALAEYADGACETALPKLAHTRIAKPHLARLYLAAEMPEEALAVARAEVKSKPGHAVPLATLAWIEHECGDPAAAVDFAELRAMSAHFDLDAPVFQRLAPLAAELGLPTDWRVPYATPADAGNRVDLDSLGPFRWSPVKAAPWSLPDADLRQIALSDYSQRPVLVIFFLGFGCVHCIEQLVAFQPAYASFRDAGIDMVAIGTDTTAQLAESRDNASAEEAYPFPIVADPGLEVFKRYRCFDDFEQMPLHGTFLIDSSGRVLWQDISYEPFMDHEFLLAESKRLLALVGSQR